MRWQYANYTAPAKLDAREKTYDLYISVKMLLLVISAVRSHRTSDLVKHRAQFENGMYNGVPLRPHSVRKALRCARRCEADVRSER